MSNRIADYTTGPEFQIVDEDGDTLRVSPPSLRKKREGQFSQAAIFNPGNTAAVYLDRADTLALYHYLGNLLMQESE